MRRGDRSRETDKYGKGKEEYGEEKKKKYLIMERDEIEIKKRKMFDERGVDEGKKKAERRRKKKKKNNKRKRIGPPAMRFIHSR